MTVIAELVLDLADGGKVTARLLAPILREDGLCWICRFEVGPPIDYALDMAGVSSMQALALSLHGLSAVLYASPEYREGRLGYDRQFDGHLGISKPWPLLGEEP